MCFPCYRRRNVGMPCRDTDLVDLLPGNRRKVYMILRNKEGSYVEGETQRSGDDWGVKAVGSGAACGGCGAGAGGVEAHHLRVEGEVWGAGRERGAAAAAAHG